MAVMVRERIASITTAVEGALVQLNETALRSGELAPMEVERVAAVQLVTIPELRSAWVTDGRGAAIAGRSRSESGPPAGLSEKPSVLDHVMNRVKGTYIGSPVLSSRAEAEWVVPVSRAARQPDLGIAAVAVAELDTTVLSSVLSTMDVGRGGVVTLIHRDGRVIARSLRHERFVGRVASSDVIQQRAAVEPVGWVEAEGPFDGVRRIYAYAAITNTPFIAIVGLAIEDLMAEVHRATVYSWGCALLVSVLLVALAVVSERVWRRRRQVQVMERVVLAGTRALKARSAFLTHMQHDLRTPLHCILGFAELVQNGDAGPVSEQQREYLGEVLGQSRMLLRIVDDMLDLAALDEGELQPRFDLVEASALLRDVEREAAALREEREDPPKLAVDLPPGGVRLWADAALVRRALTRLVQAAERMSPGRGEVRLGCEIQDRTLCFHVGDRGAALAPADIAEAIAPWTTADRFRARRHESMGLALPLVRAIAKAHGGTLDIAHKNGWNVATLTLPRAVRPV